MATSITFLNNKPEALESPISLTEGETRTFSCTYWATPTSPAVVAYRSTSGSGNGRAVTATVFPSGSASATGLVVTLPSATGFVGNAEYVISVTATVDSQTVVRYIKVRVRKDESL